MRVRVECPSRRWRRKLDEAVALLRALHEARATDEVKLRSDMAQHLAVVTKAVTDVCALRVRAL